jgi:hypothetical protein
MPIVRNGTGGTGDPLFEVTDIFAVGHVKARVSARYYSTSFYSLLSSRSARLAYYFAQIFQLCNQIPVTVLF